ncbi:uncharacterized protein LOC144344628 [Saccoglossus kowalevskii]
MINELLASNISILITEGDAVWFGNPLHLFREKPIPSDMYVNIANYADESQFCACFLYLNATRATQRVWNTLSTRLAKCMSNFKQGQQNIHFRGSEPVMFFNIAIREDPIRLTYLPRDRFASGQWYHSEDMQQNISPVVLQNNYVTGNENKLRRAQKWGHWFLAKNTTQCLYDKCQSLISKSL